MTVKVKICGLTRPEDALAAARDGADALGLVFYEASPRAVSIEQARKIVYALPPFVSSVGLFVDAPAETVREVLKQAPLSMLQFHGDESPDYCRQFQLPYLKAIRVRPQTDLAAMARDYADAAGLLLDAWVQGVPGGTGETFNWDLIPQGLDKPLILAGGLTPENVAAAVRQVRPWAVDVSGGVEREKGSKDPAKMALFIKGAKSVDA